MIKNTMKSIFERKKMKLQLLSIIEGKKIKCPLKVSQCLVRKSRFVKVACYCV
jgi:hypothetical protein